MATRQELLASVEAAREEIVALCQTLVRVPSINTGVMPTGDGIAAAILESAPNRGNLIARLAGSAGTPRLLLLSHTDVVPVEDEAAWDYLPFGAEIHDGRIYGRGANDMKSTVAAEAMALILLKRAGVELRGDVIFAAGADEESGGKWGFGWLAEHHPERLTADFGLNEGGGALVQAADGQFAYLVSTGEKGRLEIVITVKGRGWHASQPWRADNAIDKSQEVIRRIAAYEPERHVDHELIARLAQLYGITETVTAANVDRIAAALEGTNVNWASTLKAMTRMTLVASMINAGVKSNSVAESCTITCDVRTLPHQDEAYVRAQFGQTPGRAPRCQLHHQLHGGAERLALRRAGRGLRGAGARGDECGARARRPDVRAQPDARLHRLAPRPRAMPDHLRLPAEPPRRRSGQGRGAQHQRIDQHRVAAPLYHNARRAGL